MHLRTIGHKLTPTIRYKVRVPEKKAAPFYLSKEWRSLMTTIRKARGDRCEDPQHNSSSPRTGIRLYGDHIKELKDGGAPLDPANIMLRCSSCHQRKTAQERAGRYHGKSD